MARQRLTTWDSSGRPELSIDTIWVQNQINEQDNSIIISMIINKFGSYSNITTYVLYGLNVSIFGGTNYLITSGAVFFNGEIYQYQSQLIAYTGSQIPVANLLLSYDLGDPVT